MPANLPVIKSLTGRNPVISHPGTGLNSSHSPTTTGVKVIVSGNSRAVRNTAKGRIGMGAS